MKNFYTILLALIISMSAFAQTNISVDLFSIEWDDEIQPAEIISQDLLYVLNKAIPFHAYSEEYSLAKGLLSKFAKLQNDKSNQSNTNDLEIELSLEQTSKSLNDIGITNPFDFISQMEVKSNFEDISSQKLKVPYQNKSGPGCLPEPTENCLFIDLQDDGSTGFILLPFTFELYGTNYNAVYINANGNITFDNPLSEFSASGFPITTPMVAPFWGDFDFTVCGTLCYEIFPDYLIVHYQFVCPFNQDFGLTNTMAVAIGTLADPITGVGNNVVFDYRDMQWTTGNSSQGVGGFGGIPATVGINAGDNINFVQIGRFDHAGVDYDGPGGNADGVDYLDNQCISFNSTTTGNLPPAVVGLPTNEIIDIDCDETANFTIQFSGPEIGQNITVTANTNGICGVNAITTDGPVGQVDLSIVGAACNVGSNIILLSATDDGDPNETTTVEIIINVDPANCLGCTDTAACNFNPDATINDGSCFFCDDNDPCTSDLCDTATGGCIHLPIDCDDGNPCTEDFCGTAGICISIPSNCDDGNACTEDFCDTTTGGCVNIPLECDDGNPCTTEFCDPAVGCVYIPVGCNEIFCPPDLTIEWPPDFNLEPVPPNTPQDPSVNPAETGQPTGGNCVITSAEFQDNLIGPGDCPAPWVLERIWIVTNECGLTITCVQFITFTDFTPPTFNCPSDLTAECDAIIAPGGATFSDNCDNDLTIIYTETSTGECPSVLTRTWTATDDCGNSSTCEQNISFFDSTPPTIDCPQDITIEWDEPVPIEPAIATDNCDSDVTITLSVNVIDTGTCPVVSIIEHIWTATDDCGNTATCVQIISVQDTSPPTFTVPGNTTLEWPDDFNLEPVPPGTPQDPRVDPSCLSIEDQFGFGDPDWFLDLPAGEDVMQSDGTIGVNIGDVLSCALPGTNQITVSGPVLVTRGASADIALTGVPCPAVLNGLNDVIPTEIVDMTLTGDGFTLRVGEGNGIGPGAPLPASDGYIVGQVPGDNTIACSYFNIWIELEVPFAPFFLYNQDALVVIDTIDRVPPQAIYVHLFPPGFCVGMFTSPIPGVGSPIASLVEAVHKTVPIPVQDNCDPLPAVNYQDVLTGPFLGDCDTGLWVLERTWIAVDDCGNQSDPQVQLISFTDFTPPEIICPPDLTIEWGDPEGPDATGTPTVDDNCDPNPAVTFTDNMIITGDCPIGRIIERTWIAIDICGNASTCLQIIFVQDTSPPTFTAPGNTTLEWPDDFNLDPVPPNVPQDPSVDPSCLSADDQFGPAFPNWFLDLPGGDDVMQSQGIVEVNTGPTGESPIMMSGPVLVTRDDAIDLEFSIGPVFAELNGLNDVIPMEIVNMTLTGDGFTLRVGANNSEGSGESLAPSVGHIVGQIPDDDTKASSYFNIYFELEVPFFPFFLYNQEPLLLLDTIDRVGPQANYMDLFPPGFAIGLYSSPTPGEGTLVADVVDVMHKTVPIPVEDNCDLLPTVNYKDTLTGPFLGDCDTGLWVLERTWCAVDDCGNVSDPQVQLISFTDFTPPEIICPPDLNVNWGDPDDPSVTGIPEATDNCDPNPDITFTDAETITGDCPIVRIIARTWTATDLCGNSASCTQIITVVKGAPVNDNPAGALTNTPGRLWGVPGWDTFDVGCATLSAQACDGSSPTSDSWYTFVAEAENQGILARANPADPNAANVDMAVEIYNAGLIPLPGTTGGTCAEDRSCFNNVGAGIIERCVPGGLTIGATYYYRVYDAAGGATGKTLLVDTKVKTYADHPIVAGCVPLVTSSTHSWTIEDPSNLYNPVVPVFNVRMVVTNLAGTIVATTPFKNPVPAVGLNFAKSEFAPAIPDGMYNVHAQHAVKMHANGCVSEYLSQLGPACPTTFSLAVPMPNSDNLNTVSQSLSPILNFKAYPNPNQGDQVYLKLISFPDIDQNIHVTITDMYGKIVHVEQFANAGNDMNKVITFDNELSSGMYFINLTINDRIVSQKLVVE